MVCLENCILVMVIGLTVAVVAYAIIQKIFEENRKNSRIAMEAIGKAMTDITNTMVNTYDAIKVREESKRQFAENNPQN